VTAARVWGALTGLAIFALDQASKFAVVHGFGAAPPKSTYLLPILDLALHWNNGISFSLFRQNTTLGVGLLLGFAVAASVVLGVWLWRARSPLAGVGLGAIIGGALGNASDRLSYGAVVDFLDLHAFGRHFFVFNVADAAISLGVALLLIDGLFAGEGKATS
jgi:lipoprotein signal peptidase